MDWLTPLPLNLLMGMVRGGEIQRRSISAVGGKRSDVGEYTRVTYVAVCADVTRIAGARASAWYASWRAELAENLVAVGLIRWLPGSRASAGF